MKQIEIIVNGPQGSGKREILHIISRALITFGYDVTTVDEGREIAKGGPAETAVGKVRVEARQSR